MKECVNYRKLNSKILECRTCSHFCKIPESRTGICGIRKNEKGKLYLLTYGKAIAVNVDPIEKKPLFHFLPGSSAFSFGTIGCNFKCANCQNFDISQMFGKKAKIEDYDKISWGYDLQPENLVKMAIKNNCQSIAYTYIEPTIFLEYALDTMKLAHRKGLKNVWVSNGFMSDQTLDLIIPYLNAINIDIKSFEEDFYIKNCGARLKPVLENCKRLVKEKVWLEITTLIIPTLSDNENTLRKIAKFIKNKLGDFVPWHVSAFSGKISWKLEDIPDTPIKKIRQAWKIGKEEGLKYVYAGNIFGGEMENTICANCGSAIIERLGYNIKMMDNKGRCVCGNNIEGL